VTGPSKLGPDQLVDALLYEGYALYPYTPGATKNATPTPFGIVYPPAYAVALETAFDHLRVECLVEAGPEARLSAEVRFLAAGGERHQAHERSVALPETGLAELAAAEAVETFALDGLDIRLRASASPPHRGRSRVLFWVENRTPVEPGLERAAALRHALLSTHPVLRLRGGRFVSPLESPGCSSVNTVPVLASPRDDVRLGAAIMLPDHPQIAPESRGNLFDSTEIEEALLLHVQVLSDEERAAIEAHDPTVREMVARAAAATPADLERLHGRVTVRDPRLGEPEAEVDGVVFRARAAAGRRATIERLMVDYDGKVHVGVTVDGDPGQELLRETGRLLYFFADELEVV
jgi:hypothetical protein